MAEKLDTDFSFSKVDDKHKKGFLPMLVVMLGFTFFSASMWTGGELGTKVTAAEFIIAVLVGNLILGIYTSTLASIAADTGLSTHLLARYSFGKKGSFLPSLLLSFTQVGWFGVGVAMFALPMQKVTGWDLNAIVLVSGLVMTITALYGIKALTILSFIAVPSIAILGSVSVETALSEFGGLSALFELEPTEHIPMYTAISMCVATFISGGTLTPDFTRFAKNKNVAVSTTLIAFFLGNTLMFVFGAVGAAFYQESDISNVLMKQGMITVAMIVLGLNIWTTNDNALYASGLGISNITKLPKKKVVLINGILGTLMALWLYNNFVSWLSLLNTMLPAIGGIIIADYFLVKRGNYPEMEDFEFKTVRYKAIAGWALGVLAAHYLPGIAPVNGVLVAMGSYWLLERLSQKRRAAKLQTS